MFSFLPKYRTNLVWCLLCKKSCTPKRISEIAIVATSHANKCSNCIAQHSQSLKNISLIQETLYSLSYDEPENLYEKETIVYNYAVAVSEKAREISKKMFRQLQLYFGDDKIVRLTMRIALVGMLNKVNLALVIELATTYRREKYFSILPGTI